MIIHGRSADKLDATFEQLRRLAKGQLFKAQGDLSDLEQVTLLSAQVTKMIGEKQLDILSLIVPVCSVHQPHLPPLGSIDVRFVMNTLATAQLTQQLLPYIPPNVRVINLSSAAQAPVNFEVLQGAQTISDEFSAYAQSKLALTMRAHAFAQSAETKGKLILAANLGSLLGTKMVKDGFGMEGKSVSVGSNYWLKQQLLNDFWALWQYSDNDIGSFAEPHIDALDAEKCNMARKIIEQLIT